MVPAMTLSKFLKNSTYLLSALLLVACQPSPPTDEPIEAENSAAAETPLIITNDSVTMAPDHILSIKPSRYQPSLGLQGSIEPVKKTELISAHPITVEKILVSEGQWVEKGMPLLIVRRLDTEDSVSAESGSSTQESELTVDAKQKDQPDTSPNSAQSTSDSKEPSKATSAVENANVDPSSDTATNSNVATSTDSAADSKPLYNLATVRASFSGRVENIEVAAGQKLEAQTRLLHLSDESKLYFIATLPIQAKPQLSIGQTVNFTAQGISDNFTGQVSKLTVTRQPKKLLVYVEVIDNKVNRGKLLSDTKVTGRVNYGQIDVGTIVPERALHDVDLTELRMPPYKPLRPLTANVWIIGQDQRLKERPIEVVEYNPTTQQYLIAGISNDTLICLADLPVDSKGKKVIVS